MIADKKLPCTEALEMVNEINLPERHKDADFVQLRTGGFHMI